MSERLRIRESVPDFSLTVPGGTLRLSELMAGEPIFLIFHRFYGCILSQYILSVIQADYHLIKDEDVKLAVVLQSGREELESLPEIQQLDFTVVCDIEKQLFDYFDVFPAASREKCDAGITMTTLALAKELGFKHGTDSGDPLQLPAVLLLDADRVLRYAYYSENAGDLPAMEELVSIYKQGIKQNSF